MGDFTRSVDSLKVSVDGSFESEAMIMCCDLNSPGRSVENRLVDSPMPELQLISLKPDRTTQDLVSETDTEDR